MRIIALLVTTLLVFSIQCSNGYTLKDLQIDIETTVNTAKEMYEKACAVTKGIDHEWIQKWCPKNNQSIRNTIRSSVNASCTALNDLKNIELQYRIDELCNR
jgi:hypothetical protein